jgi:hypothetical protein
MNRPELLVVGRLLPPELRRALYQGWRIDSVATGQAGAIVALISADPDIRYGFGKQFQADRLRSFGTIGVLEEFDAVDINANLERLGVFKLARSA